VGATWYLILGAIAGALTVVTVLGTRAIHRRRSPHGASSAQQALIVSRAVLDSRVVRRPSGTVGSQRPVSPIRRLSPRIVEITSVTPRETDQDLAFLYTQDGPQAGEPVSLSARVTRIGRDRRWADHVVDDDTVSSIHLSIRYKNGVFVLTDLDSENGTTVNGKRVFRHALAPRDAIVIGRTTFVFMQLPAPAVGSDRGLG
jgi:pSer/pThr/pTyr-binding forkhead associated (FHA) protein